MAYGAKQVNHHLPDELPPMRTGVVNGTAAVAGGGKWHGTSTRKICLLDVVDCTCTSRFVDFQVVSLFVVLYISQKGA